MTNKEFTDRCILKHGDLYDLSKVSYVNQKTKICVICQTHGEFNVLPQNFTKGHGCPKCSLESGRSKAKRDTNWFIAKSRKVHGDKYDYSISVYTKNNEKISIICPIHGVFQQIACNHSNGEGCYACSIENSVKRMTMPREQFIKRAIDVHGYKFDYSHVELKNQREKIKILCADHGFFWQTPLNHLNGSQCPKCAIEEYSIRQRIGKGKFIEKAKIIHGDKYDYANTQISKVTDIIEIYCKRHNGTFMQRGDGHLSGNGCPECANINIFKRQQWIDRYKDIKCTFYIIKCYNDTECFYKYGITSKSISDRYDCAHRMPYKFSIIRTVIGDAAYIWDLEKRFGLYKRKDRYIPQIYFKGHKTECFASYTE